MHLRRRTCLGTWKCFTACTELRSSRLGPCPFFEVSDFFTWESPAADVIRTRSFYAPCKTQGLGERFWRCVAEKCPFAKELREQFWVARHLVAQPPFNPPVGAEPVLRGPSSGR